MRKVAIIAAFPDELRPLVCGWERLVTSADLALWRRRHGQSEWVAGCGGIGVAAALAVWAEIEKRGPADAVFSVGWAGALTPEFAAGRAYRVSGVIDAVTGERFSVTAEVGNGWLITVPQAVDSAQKRHLGATAGAGLVDMEAAGIARLAQKRGVAFYCLKAVSDGARDRLPDFNRFISAAGQFQRGRFVRFALLRPRHWLGLLRLARHSRQGAQALRVAVLEILEGPGRSE
jgi:adenosylhomocysteine nucleosidase